jgi:membrane protein required for beta-lactamase induction
MSAAYPVVWRSALILSIKWVGTVLFAVLVLLFLVLTALIFFGGGQGEIQRQVNAAIDQENHEVCGKFGMAFGTPLYDGCAATLKDVREQEHQRNIADNDFF